ncbi:LacI family transcriptional regulator [Sphaerisporangium krabiense]|uniref:LacI family transcriptional regulator n=1 Tax=Sphaerisporangium krabiense TaxID=763782 RepID=A0A7W8ZAH3_9ACTN|nr:LacI family DNA-binding transcriptional regulator [Sphaerisporangium krabiense]MBB5630423.1 LacI family transcriptional regulator [Sphaerisporangium krabiense]GII62624.1 LacI family transcriptional regulator [Sphaerisporangium krabiense]
MTTLEDVAKHAGVSLATASRVLNGSSRHVGADMRRRVESAAARLGYRVDATAQTLARGASNVVGLVIQDLIDPYFSLIADGAIRAADRHGMVTTLGTTYRDPEREIALVATLHAQRARVVLLAGSRVADEAVLRRQRAELDVYRSAGGRVAVIGQDVLGTDTVAPRNREGAYDLAVALAGLGHRRFAVLAGPPVLLTAIDRTRGFSEALADLGLPPPLLVHGDFDRDGGRDAACRLMAMDHGVTCVFAVNDLMATGALAALREYGVQVPRDLSLAGFDGTSYLRDPVPSLATVRLPLARMGAMALDLALTDEDAPRRQHVSGEVVLRDSVGPPAWASSAAYAPSAPVEPANPSAASPEARPARP